MPFDLVGFSQAASIPFPHRSLSSQLDGKQAWRQIVMLQSSLPAGHLHWKPQNLAGTDINRTGAKGISCSGFLERADPLWIVLTGNQQEATVGPQF